MCVNAILLKNVEKVLDLQRNFGQAGVIMSGMHMLSALMAKESNFTKEPRIGRFYKEGRNT